MNKIEDGADYSPRFYLFVVIYDVTLSLEVKIYTALAMFSISITIQRKALSKERETSNHNPVHLRR